MYNIVSTYNKVKEMDFAFNHAKTLCNKKQKHRTSDSLFFIFMFHSLQNDTFFIGEIYVVCELYIYYKQD